MPTSFLPVPDWFSWENQDVGLAVTDLDNDGHLDLIVFQIDNPPQVNRAYYRTGRHLDGAGNITAGWGPWNEVPDWISWDNQGADIAVADINDDGRPELIMFRIDSPAGENKGQYRIGWRLDADGVVSDGWSDWIDLPDWGMWENQGAAIALADLDGNGRLELIIFAIDSPQGLNRGNYRIGWNLDAAGKVTGGWSPWIVPPIWFSWENQGAGIAIDDLDQNGRPELIIFQVDSPPGKNGAFYSIGWDLDVTGRVTGGWSPWVAVPDWVSWENQGVSIALADLDGNGRPELLLCQIDNSPEMNQGFYRVLDLEVDLDDAATKGVWRLLPDYIPVLAVHAALLHTSDVLFFSGSSNNEQQATGPFRSAVWHVGSNTFTLPPTPIDFFCAGQSFLLDGRLLVAGGTKEYDVGHPFFGLRDAFVFDPSTQAWGRINDMSGGRWYPTLLTFSDGRVLAMSGLGEHGETPNPDLEVYMDPVGWTTLPAALSRAWPLYAHLVLLQDGRVFYSGGQYGDTFGQLPCVIDFTTNLVRDIQGLTDIDMRNQAASVLLPPAQDQRVMITGGGMFEGLGQPHQPMPATDNVNIVDLLSAHPVYQVASSLHTGRMHHNAVLLPDHTVLVCGGSRMNESRDEATLAAEIYEPSTDTWSLAAIAQVPRLYHSVALLLPDGRVVTAGSNPERRDEELRLELYYPPYLFKGSRPVIAQAPTTAAYGGTIPIRTAQAASIRSISLIRPRATTHTCDTEQRLVTLEFQRANDLLTAKIPSEPNLAPRGWYMLFLLNLQGVPSVATWIHLT